MKRRRSIRSKTWRPGGVGGALTKLFAVRVKEVKKVEEVKKVKEVEEVQTEVHILQRMKKCNG